MDKESQFRKQIVKFFWEYLGALFQGFILAALYFTITQKYLSDLTKQWTPQGVIFLLGLCIALLYWIPQLKPYIVSRSLQAEKEDFLGKNER